MDKSRPKYQPRHIILDLDLTTLNFDGSLTIDLFHIQSVNDGLMNVKLSLMPDHGLTSVSGAALMKGGPKCTR